jgi:nicotinamide riboside transporter PnuC
MKRLDFRIGTVLSLSLLAASWRGWLPFDLTETLGFVTGAACVYLVIKENIWNFPIGIANNAFYLVLFAGARLYGDAGCKSSTSRSAYRAGIHRTAGISS